MCFNMSCSLYSLKGEYMGGLHRVPILGLTQGNARS